MMRFAIYARYSSDLQNEKSAEDQIRDCQYYVEKAGGTLARIYTDCAASGASRFRVGYQQLLGDSVGGKFDVVIAEALDRLSRDQEDIAALYKHLSFHGIEFITLAEGKINELHVGLKGTMNALFLKDLAQKTKRGLEGQVRRGRSAGGKIYGYDVVKSLDAQGERITGILKYNPIEAETISRIFVEFADGKSPRQIARELNNEKVRGPRNRGWTDTTIRGHSKRGTGILNNERYVGRIVWNRQRFIKNPETGKRVARLNGSENWVTQDAPDLRIVSDNLWKSVKARQALIAECAPLNCQKNQLTGSRRRKYLLSGLLKCGVCGGGYTLVGRDRYGCANRKNRGLCSNALTIRRPEIEARVVIGLSNRLLEPDALATFINEYVVAAVILEDANAEQTVGIKKRLAQIEKRLDAIVRAIEQGVLTETTKIRLLDLERQKMELSEALPRSLAIPKPDKALIALYKDRVRKLSETIYADTMRAPAIEAIQGLIERVVITPNAQGGAGCAELYGDVAGLITYQDERGQKDDRRLSGLNRQLSVVAGTGFEPVTFRL